MGLLERVAEARGSRLPAERNSIDYWLNEYLLPSVTQFGYGGQTYPLGLGLQQTMAGSRVAEVAATLPGYAQALGACPPAFAAQMVRALVLSQTRFTFRVLPWIQPTPRKQFGTPALLRLEKPWPGGTSGDLVSLMEWHAGCAGNAFVALQPDRLRVLRPDWVAVVHGSRSEPDSANPGFALDAQLLGYLYQNGGFGASSTQVRTLLPDEVAHWAPIPDPRTPSLGMSWITPAVREIQGDRMMTEHKLQFFRNGATPNLVIKGIPATSKEKFDEYVGMMEGRHAGLAHAYKTLYLTLGADATVVGADLRQIDFKATQGAGETRIAVLSRVHPVILAIAEGLQGSALNAGNFGMARRIWADTWIYPTLQSVARALAPLVEVPWDSELWPDITDMPILHEDAKDAAEIEQIKAATIGGLVKDGFTPESAIAAVMGQNMNLLKSIPGWLSVQLQPGGPAVAPTQNQQQPNGQPPTDGQQQQQMPPVKGG